MPKLYKNAFFKIENMQKKFKIWNIQIQGLFKDFQGPGISSRQFKDFRGLRKDPMNPVNKI